MSTVAVKGRRFLVFLMMMAGWLSIVPPVAWAAAGPWGEADMVRARLVAATDAVGDRGTVPLGLHIRLTPGWKTYWRSPGDAGLPPRLDWAGSENLGSAEMRWPAPHRFTLFGLETFGYADEVVFPIDARAADPARPLDLKAGTDLLVCAEVCVPVRFDLTLSLPAGPAGGKGDGNGGGGEEANLIARFAAQVPGDGRAAGLSVTAVRAAGTARAPALEVEATAREPFVAPDLFVEMDPPMAFAAPERSFSEGGRRVVLRLTLAEPLPDAVTTLEGRALTLTLVDGDRATEATATAGAAAGGGTGLLAMLATALVGGLILNLMPCVLPVLSLKLLSMVSHAGAAPRVVRAGFLASAAGIITAFLVLAAALIALKFAGAAVGWGIQFQQPLFLVFMIVLVTLFASNLWGLFEVPLPRFLADAAERHGAGPSLAGHFATGVFATLLATPCSAPFLGTAVGFALARGAGEILAVFATLGLGLALPYLLVGAFPKMARLLPRPGRWMVALRRVLGGVLALTGLWLLSVVAVQADPLVAQVVAAFMVALVVILAMRRRLAGGGRLASGLAAACVAVAAFAAPVTLNQPAGAAPREVAGWVPFDEGVLAAAVAEGRTVFVDVTADWCLTCQVNKKLVLNRGEAARRLTQVVAMRADWTRPDERISAYLTRFGRYGIPFNIVYGPAAPEGVVLPELLSESAVLEALDKAALAQRGRDR